MNERLCNLFEACESPEAPLCPIQETTVKRGIWYPDEPICQAKQFQDISWIKKQKQIAALRLKTDAGFFTVKMLDDIHVIARNLRGADPDNSDAESKWFDRRTVKRASAADKRRERKSSKPVTREKPVNAPLFEVSSELLHSAGSDKKGKVAGPKVKSRHTKKGKMH
jgi:hypothetical protein